MKRGHRGVAHPGEKTHELINRSWTAKAVAPERSNDQKPDDVGEDLRPQIEDVTIEMIPCFSIRYLGHIHADDQQRHCERKDTVAQADQSGELPFAFLGALPR